MLLGTLELSPTVKLSSFSSPDTANLINSNNNLLKLFVRNSVYFDPSIFDKKFQNSMFLYLKFQIVF